MDETEMMACPACGGDGVVDTREIPTEGTEPTPCFVCQGGGYCRWNDLAVEFRRAATLRGAIDAVAGALDHAGIARTDDRQALRLSERVALLVEQRDGYRGDAQRSTAEVGKLREHRAVLWAAAARALPAMDALQEPPIRDDV